MSAIAKTDFLASVGKPDRDNYSVLMELRCRSPAILIVLSGQQDHGGPVRALDIGALQLVFADGGEHFPLATSHRLGNPTKSRLPTAGRGSLLLISG